MSWTPEKRLSLCMKCELREFRKETGIQCSLTHAKPTFEERCTSFRAEDSTSEFRIRHKRVVKDEQGARMDPFFGGPAKMIGSLIRRKSLRTTLYALLFCLLWGGYSLYYGMPIPWPVIFGAPLFLLAILLDIGLFGLKPSKREKKSPPSSRA